MHEHYNATAERHWPYCVYCISPMRNCFRNGKDFGLFTMFNTFYFFTYFNYFNFKIIYSSIVVKEEAILISHSHLKENTVRSGFFDPISRIKSQVISYLKSLEKFIEYRKTNKSFLKHIDILSM